MQEKKCFPSWKKNQSAHLLHEKLETGFSSHSPHIERTTHGEIPAADEVGGDDG